MLNKKKNNKGFTLVELLVVIAIIGILAVVAVPALFSNIKKAKIADMEADYSAYKSAALSYYADTNNDNVTSASITELDAYMESRPTTNPFGGDYNITGGGADNLVLEVGLNGNTLNEKEKTKIKNDLGSAVVEASLLTDTLQLILINKQ